MPKSPSQNALIKEKRKKEIMETALVLFANQGIDNVTVDNISQAMKISHGLFYHYFEDKEDLVNTLIAKSKEIFIENLKSLDNQNENSALDIFKLVTASLLSSLNGKQTDCYYLYLVLILNFQKENETKDFVSQLKDYLFKLVNQLREENMLKDLSDLDILTQYLSLFQGLAYHKIKYKNDFALPSVDTITSLFLK